MNVSTAVNITMIVAGIVLVALAGSPLALALFNRRYRQYDEDELQRISTNYDDWRWEGAAREIARRRNAADREDGE